MLRSEAVVDREQRQVELPGHLGAEGLVSVEIAEHEAAAMEEDKQRAGLASLARVVESKADRAARAGAVEIPDNGQLADLGIGDVAGREDHGPRLVRSDLMGAGARQLVVIVEEAADVGPRIGVAHRLSQGLSHPLIAPAAIRQPFCRYCLKRP